MKKTWQTPQLIVLTRSKAEEAVLSLCKSWSATVTPGFVNSMCDATGFCSGCNTVASS